MRNQRTTTRLITAVLTIMATLIVTAGLRDRPVLAGASPAENSAGSVPTVDLVTIGHFQQPVEVITRDADGRTYVVEQIGRIVAVDATGTQTVALDIQNLTTARGEQGLLGAAFHPTADFVYVNYIDHSGDSVVAEFAVDPSTDLIDPSSRRELLVVDQPYENHNGGEVAFGPDGMLYIGLGDGGLAGDPDRAALALDSRLGKILRLDPLVNGDYPYTVPADNPFVGTAEADPLIWSLGLRNPWKFSFDSLSGDLWIADVGQDLVEEVNLAPALDDGSAGRGLSFGWSAFEGNQPFNDDQPADGHTLPWLTYERAEGRCSISGGAVYRGSAIASLYGWYVYGDYCTGQIWAVDPSSGPGDSTVVELGRLEALAAIAVGADDELFAVSQAGAVARVSPTLSTNQSL